MKQTFTLIFLLGGVVGYTLGAMNTPQKTNVESYTEGYLVGNCDGALYILSKSYPLATCKSYVSTGTKMDFGSTMDIDLSPNKQLR